MIKKSELKKSEPDTLGEVAACVCLHEWYYVRIARYLFLILLVISAIIVPFNFRKTSKFKVLEQITRSDSNITNITKV